MGGCRVRVALCFSGQTRSILNWEVEIRRYLIGPLKVHKLDIFGAIETEGDTFNFPNFYFKGLLIQQPRLIINTFGLENNHEIPFRPWFNEGGVIHNIRQFHNIYDSIKLAKETELEEQFKYDFIIRARWDMRPLIPLDDLDNFRDDTLYLPKSDNWRGYNDKFAIGSSNIMELYALRLRMLKDLVKTDKKLRSETFLKWCMDKYRIPVQRLNFAHAVDRKGFYEKPHYYEPIGDTIDDQVRELDKLGLVKIIQESDIQNNFIKLG